MTVEYGIGTILAAIIINAILFAVVLGFMFKYIKQLVDQQSVDNSLHLGLKEDNKLKDIKIKNLEDQKEILMVENLQIAEQRNELAILLNQKK